ncbi:hypothetical protein OG909_26600 [Streptomyces sp. NBC_01754]|uniref:hypothetical protein n=1 Tax=Streptomyces sp. NBC_01754 TaxID=2975930 RepID=UPI002DDAD5ED|nr:hypothetical protein [Streptomyces sp. NBC_01754]WSC97066.1 hypothetical protein OG909_26600 [Streptomyces sp. NBC_01754]
MNALIGIVSIPLAAPVIAATRLRKGPSNSARGVAAFVTESIRTARACGASGLLVVRADSAFYGADAVHACRALGVRFSVTVRMNASVKPRSRASTKPVEGDQVPQRGVGRGGAVLDLGPPSPAPGRTALSAVA